MAKKHSTKDIAFEKERIKFRREIRRAKEHETELLKQQAELENAIRKQAEEIKQQAETITKLLKYSGMTKEDLAEKFENEKKVAGLADTLGALTHCLPFGY